MSVAAQDTGDGAPLAPTAEAAVANSGRTLRVVPRAAQPVIRNRWAAFAALSLIFFVVSAGAFSSIGVVLPSMVKEMNWTWQEAGIGFTVLGVACGFASVVPAVLIRSIGVRATVGIGALVLVGGFWLEATTHSVTSYLAGTTLIGLAFALVSTVPGSHVLTGLFKRRSTVLGTYFTIGALGGVAGPQVYVVVNAVTHGWRGYWLVFAAAAVASGVMAVLTTPGRGGEAPHEDEPPEQLGPTKMFREMSTPAVRRALLSPQYYVIVGAYTTYLLINTTAHGFAIEHLIERGVSKTAAAAMFSVEALIGAAVSSIGGLVGEKAPPKTLLLVALIGTTVGMIGLAEARGFWMMSVFALGLGVGFGLSFVASTMLLLRYFGPRPYLELYSIMCLLSTAAALGPAYGGHVRDVLGGFSEVFWACAGITAVMLVLTLFLKPPRHEAAAAIDAAVVPESQA
ncbi:CynX/NimT family MFS transporter [Caulobacter sp. KR2-114]|uniref:MFS transporter n=1 Tax=Caulobacter sp. KR2-114 TaxID=3400912 RepID=UPI003C0EB902